MLARLLDLELAVMERLDRNQLIGGLLDNQEALSLHLSQEWLERQSTEGLRLLLLAAKLLRVVQYRVHRPLV
jgi:hypothetical protein